MIVDLQIKDGIAYITLNRPEALNAINEAMMAGMEAALGMIEADAAVGAVVLSGAGRAFCAGSDLKELRGASMLGAEQLVRREAAMCQRVEGLPMPTIAAVHGYALGGGAALALSCDLRLAAGGSELGFPEVLLGWNPPWAMARLASAVGESAALELLMTGRRIGAEEAMRIGLVTRSVPDGALAEEARALAASLAANPPAAVRAVKRALRSGYGLPLAEADEVETRAFLECFQTAEAQAAVARFMERRRL